jgi:hypothetical protein
MGSYLRRQLLIGLDAMEWSLVKRWATQGKLPTIHRLLKEGAHGELKTTSAVTRYRLGLNLHRNESWQVRKVLLCPVRPLYLKTKNVPDDAIHGVPHAGLSDHRSVSFVGSWNRHPRLIAAIAEHVQEGLRKFSPPTRADVTLGISQRIR